jgi:hypothetical protein
LGVELKGDAEMRPGRTTYKRALGGWLASAAVSALGACILADPPAALPVPPIAPIRIAREEVSPPISLLTALPSDFVIPVTADERESALQAQLVVDQDPRTYQPRGQTINGAANVYVGVPSSVAPQECHTLEVRISYPDSTGLDSITWFYSPTGSFTGCPVFDAGPGDAALDGEGGEGG